MAPAHATVDSTLAKFRMPGTSCLTTCALAAAATRQPTMKSVQAAKSPLHAAPPLTGAAYHSSRAIFGSASREGPHHLVALAILPTGTRRRSSSKKFWSITISCSCCGRLRGFHRRQHHHALAVGRQIPPIACPPSFAIHTRGFSATNVSPFTV